MAIQLVANGEPGLVSRTKINDNFIELYTAIAGGIGSGTVTSVDVDGGTTGLTFSGGPVTTNGTITMSGVLGPASGGTGQTTYAPGELLIGKTDGTLAKATLTAGANVTITNGDGAITIAATGGGGGGSGTVTSVSGTGTVNGITLTGTVTTSGSLTLGGTLSGVDLTTAVTGVLPIANGGTGAATAPLARTALGATTVGDAVFTAVDAAAARTAIGAGTGNGTVTSVGGTGTVNGLTLTGTVTSSGNLTLGGTLSGVSLTTAVTGTLPIANGGTGATTAPLARTALGSTAVGDAVFTAVDAAAARTAIGAGTGNGTVTSVSGTGTVNGLTLTGTVTGSGDLTLGGTLSNVSLTTQVTGTLPVANGGTGATTLTGVVIGNGTSAFTVKTNPTGAFVGTTDTQTLTNKTLTSYTETVFAITDGATVNLDPNNGPIQTWTLGAIRTPGQVNWAAGQSILLMIDDGTAFSIVWTTLGVVWETDAGNAPTLSTTGFTPIVLWKVGTTIYGARVGNA